MMNLKNFHMGKLIKKRVDELNIGQERLSKFLQCQEEDLIRMYEADTTDTGILLRWCKILDYDFFRLYSHHLILHSPTKNNLTDCAQEKKGSLPVFRKNIYSKEIIDYMLELLETGKKTKPEIIQQYGIPKTTLYKWIQKNKSIGQ